MDFTIDFIEYEFAQEGEVDLHSVFLKNLLYVLNFD
jgi:hypothetical protein